MLDYELELAAVIGADGGIEGFTIMNDWSARDLQGKEMSVGLGPGQGQGLRHLARPGAGVRRTSCPTDLDMRAIARVNGEVRTDTRTGAMHWSWDEIAGGRGAQHARPAGRRRDRLGHRRAAAASSSTATAAGSQPGDEVELEIEGIGVLRNRVAS